MAGSLPQLADVELAQLPAQLSGAVKDENLFCPAKTLEKPRNRRKNLKPFSSVPVLRRIRAVDHWRVVQPVPTIPC